MDSVQSDYVFLNQFCQSPLRMESLSPFIFKVVDQDGLTAAIFLLLHVTGRFCSSFIPKLLSFACN